MTTTSAAPSGAHAASGNPVTGAVLALAGAMLWGTTGTSQALMSGSHSPVAVGALRATIAAVVLTLAALAHGAGAWVDAARRSWRPLLVAGVAVAGYQLTFFAAVTRTGVGVGTLVTLATSPAVAGLLGWLLHGERPRRVWAVATVVALLGAALLVLGSGADRHVDAVGLLLAVAAGACFGGYTVAGRLVAASGADGLAATSWVFLVAGGLLLVPLSRQPLDFVHRGHNPWIIAWLGVVATAVAYLLYQSGMRHVAAATASTLALAEPMVANLLAVVVLHEPFTLVMGAGALVVLGGLLLLARS